MRTTFTLDADVAAEVERLRRHEGVGISEAVNSLIRQGLSRRPPRVPYEHQADAVGLSVDVSDVGAILDLLDDPR